jgi:signal transduction histidine kinase
MSACSLPPFDEEARLAELHSYGILDTGPDGRFDRLTRLASTLFRAPIALISLVDRERQWFKSAFGLEIRETARDLSFCSHAIEGEGIMVVEDALADERFRSNPLVTGAPNIRFYAGAPIATRLTNRLGTLCIIDTKPRVMPEEERALLAELACIVLDEMKLHKTLVELRRRSAAAEAAAKAKGDFLAVMSHELRTPLNAISGAEERLSSELYGPLGHAKYTEYAHLIGNGGRHLLDVIGNILDMSGAESGSEIELGPLDIQAVVEETANLLQAVAQPKKIRLQVQKLAIPMYVIGNYPSVRKVLLNVIGNAIKYSPPGSRVSVAMEPYVGHGDFVVRIDDNGVGIAREDLRRLGEPFFRAASAMVAVEGTGLGVAISKRLMGKMRGTLTIDSEPGKGTSVSLRFRTERTQAASQALAG